MVFDIGIIERLKRVLYRYDYLVNKTSLNVCVQYDGIRSLKGKQKCVWASNMSFESVHGN